MINYKMDTNITLSTPNNNLTLDENVIQTEVQHIQAGTIIWASVNGLLFVLILGGNILTIIAVRTCRRLRAMISNLFILSLAISDLIVGISLPYHLTFYLGSNLGQSHGLCLMRFFLIIFACCVSILTLIAIAIDRYIAIVYALHYRRYMTRRVALLIIAFNWFAGASVAAIPMFWNHWNTASQCEFDEILPRWYMAGVITPGFILIWLCMSVIYWRIMREASKHARQLRTSITSHRPSVMNSDWKSVQIVVFIMGCFSMCWLPYFVVACSQIFEIHQNPLPMYKAAFSLAMSNSVLNPIIYSWKNSNFRKAFSRLLHCKSPNTCEAQNENIEVHSQCSVRTHYLPRQNSVKSIVMLPMSVTNLEMVLEVNQTTTNATSLSESGLANRSSIMQHQSESNYQHDDEGEDEDEETIDREDSTSQEGGDEACNACVFCKNLLRKATTTNHTKHSMMEEHVIEVDSPKQNLDAKAESVDNNNDTTECVEEHVCCDKCTSNKTQI